MTLEAALKSLLRRYADAVKAAEEAGDDALAATLRRRRNQLSRLQGLRCTAERRRNERLWGEHDVSYRRLEGEGC
jgi:hypothetical protein